MSHSRPFTFALLPLSLLAGTTAFAQTTTTPTGAAAEKKDEIVELSPFEVAAETETGWVATQSLAGSRLNTSLKDIAAPIEVLTKDFTEEFALNSIEQATIYTTNVEGVGDNLETGPGNGIGVGFPPPTRIRGLGNGTLSRDFFAVKTSSDNYNLDRITIASGPNNLLFGTGSPAGVIDTSLKRAQMREITRVDLQVDSRGSQRYALDINRMLIPNVLAARFNVLHEDRTFEYKPNGFEQGRLHGAIQFRPFKGTTISIMHENSTITTSRPSLLLPWDNVSPWFFASTIPGYTHTTDKPAFNNPATGAAFPSLNNTIFVQESLNPLLVYGDNNAAGNLPMQSFRNTVTVKSPKDLPGVSSLNNEADGWTFLDDTYFPTNVNVQGLTRKQRIKSDVTNFFLTQRITKDLFLEAAAQNESYYSQTGGIFGYVSGTRINVDPNRFLPDGVTNNPNFGKYFVEGSLTRQENWTKTSDWRVAVSYERDFRKDGSSWWRSLLGKQRIGGLVSGNKIEDRDHELDPHIIPDANGRDPVIPGVTLTPRYNASGAENSGWATNATRTPQFRYYLGDDGVAKPFSNILAPSSFKDANGTEWSLDGYNTGIVDQLGHRVGANRVLVLLKQKLETQQFSYQGFFWDNRIVATLGWRKDTTNTANVANNGNVNHISGLRPLAPDVTFKPYDPATEQSGTTTTQGVVVRPLAGWVKLPLGAEISLAYNTSDTFQPNVAFYDPFGERYPGALGGGEDKSVRLDLFEGKFSLRYTDFDNTAGPARAGNVPFNRFRFTLSGVLNRVMQLAYGDSNQPITGYTDGLGFNKLGNGDPYWVTSNQHAFGDEISLDWNVTKSFQLRFNMNRQTVVESDIGLDWWKWLETEIPKYQALTFPEGGVANPRDVNGDGTIGTWNWNTATRGDSGSDANRTIAQAYQSDVIDGSTGQKIIQSLDGKSNEFVRDNRYNLIWTYRFLEGRLNGLSIGGAFRHRAAPLISYGSSIINGREQLDLSKTYYGKSDNMVDLNLNYRGKTDLWGIKSYRVGLVVRNALNEDSLYQKLVDVSGNPIRMGRVSEDRTFILSVSFDL